MPLIAPARLKDTEPGLMAVLEREGSHHYVAHAFEELFAWVYAQELEPVGPPIGVFHHDPAHAKGQQAPQRWSVQVRVGSANDLQDIPWSTVRVQRVERTTVAVVLYQGDIEAIAEAYAALYAWMAEHGYQRNGPSQEVYLSAAGTTIDESVIEVRIPVAPQ